MQHKSCYVRNISKLLLLELLSQKMALVWLTFSLFGFFRCGAGSGTLSPLPARKLVPY